MRNVIYFTGAYRSATAGNSNAERDLLNLFSRPLSQTHVRLNANNALTGVHVLRVFLSMTGHRHSTHTPIYVHTALLAIGSMGR